MRKILFLLFMAVAVPVVFAMVAVTSSEVADASQQVVMLSQGQNQIQIAEMATPLLQEEVLAVRVEEVIVGITSREYAMGTMDIRVTGWQRTGIGKNSVVVIGSEVTIGQLATATCVSKLPMAIMVFTIIA